MGDWGGELPLEGLVVLLLVFQQVWDQLHLGLKCIIPNKNENKTCLTRT